jgi:CO dehydrogenase nickel-insertion accessory protein CooC1
METAALIKKMVEVDKVIRCEKLGLVFNRVRGNEDLLRDAAREMGLDLFGLIPFDENIATHDLLGKPLTELPADSPAFAAFCRIVEERVLR